MVDRVRESKGERLSKLTEWSGTAAVTGSLEMCNSRMEGAVEELQDLIKKVDSGVIYNTDKDDAE